MSEGVCFYTCVTLGPDLFFTARVTQLKHPCDNKSTKWPRRDSSWWYMCVDWVSQKPFILITETLPIPIFSLKRNKCPHIWHMTHIWQPLTLPKKLPYLHQSSGSHLFSGCLPQYELWAHWSWTYNRWLIMLIDYIDYVILKKLSKETSDNGHITIFINWLVVCGLWLILAQLSLKTLHSDVFDTSIQDSASGLITETILNQSAIAVWSHQFLDTVLL